MTCLPTAQWFLYSEAGEPLGSVYRSGDGTVPAVGAIVDDAARTGRVEVLGFDELRPTCSMRRFRVVVRMAEGR